ncbi:MAG: arylsulfatase [Caldilineales bacterium]
MEVSRRDFVKICGAGAAAAGLGSVLPAKVVGAAAGNARTSPAGNSATARLAPMLESNLRQRLQTAGPVDPLIAQTVQIAANMEPVIPHDDQAAAARRKLAALEKKTGKKPNILIFLMDNVGYGDIGINGGGLLAGAPTPNIDRLGQEGLHLLSAYSQPSCTPTRVTMLTGRLPMRTGALHPGFAGQPGVLENETTLAQVLSEAGYVTQAIGKWHCGEDEGSQPQNVGFDDFYGFLGWSGLYTDWRDESVMPEWVLRPERQAFAEAEGFDHYLVHAVKGKEVENLEELTIDAISECDQKFAAYAEDFIERVAGRDQPFFLYHCTRGAHVKNYPSARFKGKSPAKYPYKDCMVEMDDIVGRLVKTLDDTDQLDNTLIFVLSDNGPMMEPWPDAGYTPFRGGIGSTWEGGVRVPAVAYWKGMIKPGRVSDEVFDLADLFTTSAALAGVAYRPPDDQYLDGIDQTSFLVADDGQSNRKYVYFWLGQTLSGLRVAEYKFMVAGMSFDEQDVVNGESATVQEAYPMPKLFNLYLDPKERYSFFDRQTFLDNLFSEPMNAHVETFQEYPDKKEVIKQKILDLLSNK